MNKRISLALVLVFLFTLMVGCGKQAAAPSKEEAKATTTTTKPTLQVETETFDDNDEAYDGVKIHLSDEGITVDGEAIAADTSKAVYAANDIVYYESGKDFTYGEGTEKDAHTKAEADAAMAYVKTEIEKIAKLCDKSWSDMEKVLFFHDYFPHIFLVFDICQYIFCNM